jgi:uncharacterized coiled-coil protein SlyX
MEATLSPTLETRVALLEASVEERKGDIADTRTDITAIKAKLDRLTTTALCFTLALLADIVLEKTGLLSPIFHH